MRVYGVDFTCAPRRAKPITVASCSFVGNELTLAEIEPLRSFDEFEAFLARRGPWIGGFDFPFSVPRELVRDLGWPEAWPDLVRHCASFPRKEFRTMLDEYRARRPPGSKYAHRATDGPAGSSSPMKLVNPPVALMFHEGAPRLLQSRVRIPALMNTGDARVALEAYPGLLVRKHLGIRASYKSDTRSEQTPQRAAIRRRIVQALKAGRPLGIALVVRGRVARRLVQDGSGDSLDAAICALQAAWALGRPSFGLPRGAPENEGWIISADLPSAPARGRSPSRACRSATGATPRENGR